MEIHLRYCFFCKTAPLGKIHYSAVMMLIINCLQPLYYSPAYSDKNGKGVWIHISPLKWHLPAFLSFPLSDGNTVSQYQVTMDHNLKAKK